MKRRRKWHAFRFVGFFPCLPRVSLVHCTSLRRTFFSIVWIIGKCVSVSECLIHQTLLFDIAVRMIYLWIKFFRSICINSPATAFLAEIVKWAAAVAEAAQHSRKKYIYFYQHFEPPNHLPLHNRFDFRWVHAAVGFGYCAIASRIYQMHLRRRKKMIPIEPNIRNICRRNGRPPNQSVMAVVKVFFLHIFPHISN